MGKVKQEAQILLSKEQLSHELRAALVFTYFPKPVIKFKKRIVVNPKTKQEETEDFPYTEEQKQLVAKCAWCGCGYWGNRVIIQEHFELLGTEREKHLRMYKMAMEASEAMARR